jgi:hypothetical protein
MSRRPSMHRKTTDRVDEHATPPNGFLGGDDVGLNDCRPFCSGDCPSRGRSAGTGKQLSLQRRTQP